MTYAARILADSIGRSGVRLTTFETTLPRIVLAELNTHRMLSKSSASSRAIPVKRMIERVLENPYIPSAWGRDQRGMQGGERLVGEAAINCEATWLTARDRAVKYAEKLRAEGVHKQLTNRLLEPWMWHTVIITATEWGNFFHLRDHKDAHPDIQKPAALMRGLYQGAVPHFVDDGEWHLPLIQEDERDNVPSDWDRWKKVSVGRCARVSYLTHDGIRDVEADVSLTEDKLEPSGHMSPLEHVARPMDDDERRLLTRWWVKLEGDSPELPFSYPLRVGSVHGAARVLSCEQHAWCGNLDAWVQYRKTVHREADMLAPTV